VTILENDDDKQSVKTGDIVNSMVEINQTVINGFTIEQHESILKERLAETRVDLARLHEADKSLLEMQKQFALESLNNLSGSYQQKVEQLQIRLNELSKIKKELPDDIFNAAQVALLNGDTRSADKLYANLENESTETLAEAVFERGNIAFVDIRWEDALKHFEKARFLKPDNFEYAHALARQYKFSRNYNKTEKVYKDEISRLSKFEDKKSKLDLSSCYNSLGLLYLFDLKKFDQAFEHLKKANEINILVLGSVNERLATDYNNLGLALKKLCELMKLGELGQEAFLSKTAEHYYLRAINIYEITQNLEGLAHTHLNIASLYMLTDDLIKAECYTFRSSKFYEEKLGKSDPKVINIYFRLVSIYQKLEKYSKAEPYLEAIKEVCKTFNPQYPNLELIKKDYNQSKDKQNKNGNN
jgi:tetratricopeptide (TPR) repeat protein